jgi:exopolysaccharide production protein ExoZ
MIRNLQLLRGLAALGVVFYHTGFQIVPGISTDFFGVAVFFVLSGFIMCHVTRLDGSNFVIKRFIRVVPLYWLTTIVFFFLANFGLFNFLYTLPTWWSLAGEGQVYLWAWFSAQMAGIVAGGAAHNLATSLLFIPTSHPPTLGVGWTLNLEVLFYGIFALSLAISARWAPLIALIGIFLTQAISSAASCGAPCAAYSSFSPRYFAIGIAAYYIWIALRERAQQWRLPIAVCSLVTLFAVIGTCILSKHPGLIAVAAPLAVVVCAVMAESAGIVCRMGPLLVLGDMSYSLYLTHLFIIEPIRIIGERYPWFHQKTSVAVVIFSIAACLLFAYIVHRFIEVPMLAKLRVALRAGSLPKPLPALT